MSKNFVLDVKTMKDEEIEEMIKAARAEKKQRHPVSGGLARDRYMVSVGKAVNNCLQAIAKLSGAEGVTDETWTAVENAIAPLSVENYRASAAEVTVKVRKGGGGRKKKIVAEQVAA